MNSALHTICGDTHQTPMHACAFFDSRDEQYQVILPYIAEGIARGEKVVNILSEEGHTAHCHCLSGHGIEVEKHLLSNQLELMASEETYLAGGHFTADKMLALLENALLSAAAEGYHSVRACGEMEWALSSLPGTDELIEYEARLNLLTPRHSCSLICMYDINKFSGRVLADVLATHSHVIMNGRMHKNPYYVQPLEFLPLLHRRKQASLEAAMA